MDLTLTTELKAVNMMLESIGEQHVASLPSSLYLASLAQTILARNSRVIQLRGWHCNTTDMIQLSPDPGTGKIAVPSNAVRVDSLYKWQDVVIRGAYLYDRTENTDVFTTDVYASVTYVLDFEQLPDQLRQYIAVKAAREYQKKTVGDEATFRFTQEDEDEARTLALGDDMRQAQVTILDHDPSRRIVNRRA